jgi:hypothetical protein
LQIIWVNGMKIIPGYWRANITHEVVVKQEKRRSPLVWIKPSLGIQLSKFLVNIKGPGFLNCKKPVAVFKVKIGGFYFEGHMLPKKLVYPIFPLQYSPCTIPPAASVSVPTWDGRRFYTIIFCLYMTPFSTCMWPFVPCVSRCGGGRSVQYRYMPGTFLTHVRAKNLVPVMCYWNVTLL